MRWGETTEELASLLYRRGTIPRSPSLRKRLCHSNTSYTLESRQGSICIIWTVHSSALQRLAAVRPGNHSCNHSRGRDSDRLRVDRVHTTRIAPASARSVGSELVKVAGIISPQDARITTTRAYERSLTFELGKIHGETSRRPHKFDWPRDAR